MFAVNSLDDDHKRRTVKNLVNQIRNETQVER